MRNFLYRFRRETDGATAIEAVFIIPIFFALVFSTFEVGYVFFRTAVVETVASDAARMVVTGRAPRAGPIAGAACASGSECFYNTICGRVEVFGDCDEHLSVEVRSFETMAEASAYTAAAICPNTTGYDRTEMEYDPGDRNSYAMVRICFTARSFNPAVGINLAHNDDGTKSLVAVQIRRNEPYLSEEQVNPNEVL